MTDERSVLTTGNDTDTCVLALVMLKDVGDIPAKPSGPLASRSVGSFRRVLDYLDELYECCLLESHQLGWTEFSMLTFFPYFLLSFFSSSFLFFFSPLLLGFLLYWNFESVER